MIKNKSSENLQKNEQAVSELIGALVLISMIVLVVAVISAFIINQPSSEKVPELRFSVANISGHGQCPGNCSFLVTHTGGDRLNAGEYAFFINDNSVPVIPGNINPEPMITSWSVGESLVINTSFAPGYIRVYYYNKTKVNNPALIGQRVIGEGSPLTPVPANYYVITPSAGSGGSISPPAPQTVTSGSGSIFTMTPQPGYSIADVKIDGISVGAVSLYTFTNVQADHTIAASFTSVPSYTITASTSTSGGTISPSGAVSVTKGNSQSFTITPQPGYAISEVIVDGTTVGAVTSYTFTNVQADHTIIASFMAVPLYIISSSTSTPGGSISPLGAVLVTKGNSQTFNITSQPGYTIADVKVDGSSQGSVTTYTFSNVVANHTIVASFITVPPRTITSSTSTPGGTISPLGVVSVPYGGNQSYTITPQSGYGIADVKVDGVSVGQVSSYTFSNVQTDHTIVASFSVMNLKITATAGTGGTISPPGTTTVSYGATPTYTITPSTGYHVADVLVNGSSVGAVTSYTFQPVTTDKTIAATFAINQYTITASVNNNVWGSINPPGTTTVSYGATPTYTITPATGFHITDVLVNGVSVGVVSSYTFSPVTSSQVIYAVFSPDAGCPYISGFKWNDQNDNAIRDPGEPGLGNWQIDLYAIQGNKYVYISSTITDSTGYYIFKNIQYTEQYEIRELQKTGWRATNPASGIRTKVVVNPGAKCYSDTNDFGNYLVK